MTKLPTFTKLPREQWFDENTPPDSLQIVELRRMQKAAGYKSPRTLKEERQKEQLKKKDAGKKSALVRKERAEQRLNMIKRAYDQLDPKYKTQPYSKDSIDALSEQLVVLSSKRASRPPPTEDELRSFALDIESILQLPEDVRMQVLRDEYYAFEHNLPSPWQLIEVNGKPIGDDAPKALLQDKKFPLDEENDDANQLPSGSEIDVGKLLAGDRKALWRDLARAPLSQVSRATLTRYLKLLGVKGKRQGRRPR